MSNVSDVSHAAVAAVLLPDDALLFIRRAVRDGDPWSGHVAFPGGRAQADDDGPKATAMRETREELGLDLSTARFRGQLEPLRPISGMPLVVHPFFWALDQEPVLTPNVEVQSTHRLPVRDLLAGVGRGEFTFHWNSVDHVLPCVDFDGLRLWGMTLRIVDDLALHLLRAP